MIATGYAYDTPEAGELFQEVLAIRRRVLGDEDDATIYSMYELAEWQFRQGDLEACRKNLSQRTGNQPSSHQRRRPRFLPSRPPDLAT